MGTGFAQLFLGLPAPRDVDRSAGQSLDFAVPAEDRAGDGLERPSGDRDGPGGLLALETAPDRLENFGRIAIHREDVLSDDLARGETERLQGGSLGNHERPVPGDRPEHERKGGEGLAQWLRPGQRYCRLGVDRRVGRGLTRHAVLRKMKWPPWDLGESYSGPEDFSIVGRSSNLQR
jgi:hypothetical protein